MPSATVSSSSIVHIESPLHSADAFLLEPLPGSAWRARARTIVAYRERHQITDPWSALGTVDKANAQQRREEALATHAMTPSARPKAEPAIRSTSVSAPATRFDPIGR